MRALTPAQGSTRCLTSSRTQHVASPTTACARARTVCAAAAALVQTAADSQHLQPVQSQPGESAYATPPSLASSHLLAAVAGAAAVAAAGADLQTAILPSSLLQDSNTITITAQALFYDSDGNCSSCEIPQLTPEQSRQLTSQITNSSSWQDLLLLHTTYEQQMNIIHVSAMLSKLGKLLRDAAVVPVAAAEVQLLQRSLQKLEQTSLLLMAHVQLQQPAVMQVLRSVGHQLFVQEVSSAAAGPQQLPVQPQQLSTIAWGFATAGHQPGRRWWSTYFNSSMPLLPTYTPQELAIGIWAVAKLQQHPPATWMSGYMSATAAALESGTFGPQEMCMMLWGFVQLNVSVESSWWAGLQSAVEGQLQQMKPRDVAQVLWSHARLSALPPRPWLSQVLAAAGAGGGTAAATAHQLQRYSGRDVAMLLWALAAMQKQQQEAGEGAGRHKLQAMTAFQQQQQQQEQLVEVLLRNLQMSNCKLAACGPQDFAHILWSVAVLIQHSSQQQQQQEDAMQQTCHQLQHQHHQHHQQQQLSRLSRNCTANSGRPSGASYSTESCTLDHVSPHAAVHSSSSAERQQLQQSSCTWNDSSSSRSSLLQSWTNLTWHYTQPTTSGLGPVDAAQLLWAASQFGREHWPDQLWMQQFWETSRQQIGHYNAQSLTVAMWAAYKMRHQPPRAWLVAATPVIQLQLADLQPAAACQLLYVLAKLQHRPNPEFMQQLLSRLQLDSHQLQPRAFACVLWSLGRLGYQPGFTWWAVVLTHLSERVSELGFRELQNVVWGLLELRVKLPAGLLVQLQQRLLELQPQ